LDSRNPLLSARIKTSSNSNSLEASTSRINSNNQVEDCSVLRSQPLNLLCLVRLSNQLSQLLELNNKIQEDHPCSESRLGRLPHRVVSLVVSPSPPPLADPYLVASRLNRILSSQHLEVFSNPKLLRQVVAYLVRHSKTHNLREDSLEAASRSQLEVDCSEILSPSPPQLADRVSSDNRPKLKNQLKEVYLDLPHLPAFSDKLKIKLKTRAEGYSARTPRRPTQVAVAFSDNQLNQPLPLQVDPCLVELSHKISSRLIPCLDSKIQIKTQQDLPCSPQIICSLEVSLVRQQPLLPIKRRQGHCSDSKLRALPYSLNPLSSSSRPSSAACNLNQPCRPSNHYLAKPPSSTSKCSR